MPRRCFEIEVGAIGEQVNVGGATDDFSEGLADLAGQEAHDLSYPLQGKALAPKLADDGHFGEVLHGVEATMTFPFGLDYSAFVPVLELAGGDAGEGDHVVRSEAVMHWSPICLKQFEC